MSIIVCNGISLSYGAEEILNNISFSLNAGDKLGVIGVNGAGKSTLFSIIQGALDPSSGDVFINNGLKIGCLRQINDSHKFGCTVLETALDAFEHLIKLENEISTLRERMENGDEAAIKAFLNKNEQYNLQGGNEYISKTKTTLLKFGFSEKDLNNSADNLSGGQKTKLLLVKLLLSNPDIIMLDEPTNHLDTQACEWLESFISNSKKTFLIISHDRYFLDKTTNKTLEISHGVSEIYDGNYTTFREKKKALDEAKLKHYNLQQKEIARLEAFIENQRKWNREKNIIAAESRQKTIDKMVKLEKPKEKERAITFKIADTTSSSNDVLSVRSLGMSYDGNFLFKNISFELKRGERLFIIGPNGCGKSTLLKILTNREKQVEGIFELGYNQSIGYYDQEQQLLDQSNTVIDEIWNIYSDKSSTEIRSMLAQFGFRGDDVFKTVSVLSGGERARLSIAKMIACGVSLLVLDEPTNHLDIDSREVLERALLDYNGTVITVSHDRYFIKNLATAVLEIDKIGFENGYNYLKCSYEEYLNKRVKIQNEVNTKSTSGIGKNDYIASKQRKNHYRSAVNRYAVLEKEIENTELELSNLKEKENNEEFMRDYAALNEIYDKQSEISERIDKMYHELEELEGIITSYTE